MNFARALFTVSSLTIISRVGGFIRDTLTAMILGAGPVADAYFVAQRLPNLFRSLFAEGAFSAAFVPLFTTEQEKSGVEAARQFAGQALALLLSVLVPFSLLVMLAMPWVIRVIAPGFHDDGERFHLAVIFSVITFPYLALISVAALQGGVLNARGKFAAPAAAPAALNIVMISALVASLIFHLNAGYMLAGAFTFGGLVQMTWLVVSCRRAGVSIPLVMPHLTEAGRKLFKRIGPGAIGAGAGQINLFLSNILASLLPIGAISHLFYADRVQQLPLGIVGVAVATTLLPLLSRHVQSRSEDRVRHYTNRAIEFCLMLGVPAAIGLAVAARPIIETLFQHGAFTHADTRATAAALAAYALGIPAFLLVKVFSSGFFARHDTKTPVKTAVAAMLTNAVCAIALLGPLQQVGIALANSIALWVNVTLLFALMRRAKHPVGDATFRARMPRLLFCAVGMAAVTYSLVRFTHPWFAGHHLAREIGGLAVIIGVSGLAYGLFLQLTGAMRLGDVLAILKRKGGVEDVVHVQRP
ncbi:MAG TPA: murein biosynthesis integral membrane protein MurJ [Alphaproteobacteria bacterium]|nr:murein biosynthesis integral membrane protein MurJ [Alphaproteobacteria bacterium]